MLTALLLMIMKIADLAIVVRMIVTSKIFAVICADAYNTCNNDDVHSAGGCVLCSRRRAGR